MEKSIASFTESLDQTFRLSDKDWKMYSPLTLAYIGDAAYELIIRTVFVKQGNTQPQKLHRRVISCVSAKTQAKMIEALLPVLTEEEAGIYRRGRNSKPYTKAKNATMTEYLEATGFEAVMGYLYLKRDFERMNELVKTGLELVQVRPSSGM
ncbi:MAG: ribonuclease III domain-containing protein [Candidatus Choladocola sp.]|nr:ribonuclease III domain-containing protein [Candidatus Choladocola sp.]